VKIFLYELINKENEQEIVYASHFSDIEKYAKAKSFLIKEEIKSYSPAMLLKYYKWVGTGNNPCVVSRPWKYK